jgi:hypothetical protein
MEEMNMTHQERTTKFLAARNLTMEQANALPLEARKALDAEFRAERRAEKLATIEGSVKISRAEMKKMLPVGESLTLIYAMGEDTSKPRVVAEHMSYGFEFHTPEGRLSSLRFEKGETIRLLVRDGYDIVSILSADGWINVQYQINREVR